MNADNRARQTPWRLWLAVLLGCLAGHAEPSLLVDLDFAGGQNGVIPNVAPDREPAVVSARTAYGRLRGQPAVMVSDASVAGPAMGRGGALDALRLGNDGAGLRVPQRLRTGQPFSLELWLFVYGVRTYFSGSILVTPPGPVHGRGISLGFQRARWSQDGWVEWRWGKGKGSDGMWHHGFAASQWHQLSVTYDGEWLALYVDGEVSDRRREQLLFDDGGQQLAFGQTEPSRGIAGLDYKLDALKVYDGALTAEQVKAHYAAGAPGAPGEPGREQRLLAMKLSIPTGSYGYFRAGEAIPVTADGNGLADTLVVNGTRHRLPLAEPVALSYPEPGFQLVDLALTADGQLLRREQLPVAITTIEANSSFVGVADMASRQPEVRALGINLNRVVVRWAELEPEKQVYDWTRLDAVMARSRELGAETILCFTGLPRWLPVANEPANLPPDLAAYTTMWRLLANRYDGVAAYEVWNATYPRDCFRGSPQQRLADYRELLTAAAAAIRRERPGAVILAGRLDLDPAAGTAAYLQREAPGLFDVFSFRLPTRKTADPAQLRQHLAALRAATSKPLWNTEGGLAQFGRPGLLPAPRDAEPPPGRAWPLDVVGEWRAAACLIADLAIQRASGVERVVLLKGPSVYEPDGCASTGLPGVEGLALIVFNGLTGGRDGRFSTAGTPSGATAVRFQRPDGAGGLLIAAPDGMRELPVKATGAAPIQLYDMLGKPLPAPAGGTVAVTAWPIYLLNADLDTPTPGNQP